MKEIKFRAWITNNNYYGDKIDTNENKMIYLNLYQCVSYNTDFVLREKDWGDGNWIDDHLDKPIFELMQYTGLKDKNGVEIYEGDIIICEQKNKTKNGLVVFKDGGFWVEFEEGMFAFLDGAIKKFKGKIIGDIYKNPELLNK